jgi:hypothetical protein
MNMALNRLLALTIAAMAFVSVPAVADNSRVKIQHTVDPKTSIESWVLQDDGVEVELIQISPDQARGFFLARGFNRADVDYYAASCVFATVVRNQSPVTVTYHLANWRYAAADGVTRKLKLKDDWLREWQQRGASKSAQIAFEWSQHPTNQTLEPNDWNQGMTTYQVPHGSRLNLTVKWKKGNKNYVDTIRGVSCAD